MFEFIIGGIKPENVFVGTIRNCIKYRYETSKNEEEFITKQYSGIKIESKIYKENVVLIKLKNNKYIALDQLNELSDYLKIRRDMSKKEYIPGSLIIPTAPKSLNCLFVDKSSLQSYYVEAKEQGIKNVKVKQLKLNEKGGDIHH